MNRRTFIKTAGLSTALATWTVTCKYEEKEHEPKKEALWKRWDYRVYCYERGQGEWLFSENTRGSFDYQREYMPFDEENDLSWNNAYSGWMNDGKLHFSCFDDAVTFVDCHVRTKDDTNLIDSVYDIYFISRDTIRDQYGVEDVEEYEIHVAHYWFNGDTGKQISWEKS